jgi:hypothetical protein
VSLEVSLRQPSLDSSPPNIEWRSADASTRVSLSIGLADRIAGYVLEAYKSIPRRGAEAGGLLLGGVRLGPVIDITITGFHPIPCDYQFGPSFIVSEAMQAEFKSAKTRFPASEILGYYRSHTRKSAALDTSDQDLVDRVFPGLSGLVLLITPFGISKLTGAYYFFQNGRLETRPVGPEFAFVTSVPGGTPPPPVEEPEPSPRAETDFRKLMQESLGRMPEAPVEAAPPPRRLLKARKLEIEQPIDAEEPPAREAVPETRPAAVSEPRPAAVPEPRPPTEGAGRRKKLQWEIVASGLMVAAALALLWWQYRGASGEDETPAAQSAAEHIASLGLKVHPGQGGWWITWDPTSRSAREAVRGVLNVVQGTSTQQIPLNPSQIRTGAITFRPSGDDITFRLDLIASNNAVATETFRVLVESREPKSATAPTAAPVPATTAPATTTAKAKPAAEPPAEPEIPAEKPSSKAAKKKPAEREPEQPAEETSFVDSEVVTRVAPEVPEGIRPRITAPLPIDVRVSINREGKVTKAAPLQHEDGLVDFLAKRAVAAAQKWTFTPAKRSGKPVDSTRTIHFVFEQ